MPKAKDSLWDETDPYYAPGRARLKREHGYTYLWRPRKADIEKGFLPKSLPLPAGDDDAAVRERAALCRQYERELHTWRLQGQQTKPRQDDGTFAAIADRYERDEDSPFHDLRHSTQTNYRYYLKPVVKKLGKRRIAHTTGKDLRRWHKEFVKQFAKPERGHDGIPMARQCMQIIRILAKYAFTEGHDDCQRVAALFEHMTFKGGRARTQAPEWADIQALVAKADEKGRPSIGTATLMQFELAQRQGDIIGVWEPTGGGEDQHGIVHRGKRWSGGVLWSDIGPDWTLTIVQNKTGKALAFPIKEYPALYDRLQAVPKEKRVGPIIISDSTGRPYQRRDFAATFREIATAAGWPEDMRNMDARAGAATEIADAVQDLAIAGEDVSGQGFTRSHTGHRDSRMEDRYTRTKVETVTRVARMRIARRDKTVREH